MTKTILPGAWKPTKDFSKEVYSLYVPQSWRQVAYSLAHQRATTQGRGYPSIPVYSLDPLIAACFPQIIKTVRKGWQRAGVPWLFATESADLADLPLLIKDWLRVEFSEALGETTVDSMLETLDDRQWCWSKPKTYSLLEKPVNEDEQDVWFKLIPDYLAQEFLKNPTVVFNDKKLTFYRVVRLNKGAELMSYPPYPVLISKGEDKTETAYISFVIRFALQTVPWRQEPIVYHQLSVRRWITKPLVTQEKNYIPYRGVTAYIGDNHRWLDGTRQGFCLIPLALKRWYQGGEVDWHKAIKEILVLNDSKLPEPITLASDPTYRWSEFNADSGCIQAAIAYDTRHYGKPPSLPGLNRRDFDDLDQAINKRLPVVRVGEAEIVIAPVKKRGIRYWEDGQPKTPMLRPNIATAAAFSHRENLLRTILIIWETGECRDVLIAKICELLSLSPTVEVSICQTSSDIEVTQQVYQGEFGSLCIQTLHVSDLTQDLNINNPEVPGRSRQQRRIHLLNERIQQIQAYLPPTREFCGALVEIKKKPPIPEKDPKLAWRIGAMRAGYLNQHIHQMELRKQVLTESSEERAKRAVSDLLRQFGILPNKPLIVPEIDGIKNAFWLTCFYVLRRTKKTNAESIPKTVVLMVRVNAVTAEVEFTTPELFWEKLKSKEKRWVSSPMLLQQLINEKWDPDAYFDAFEEINDDEKKKEQQREQNLLTRFVGECLQDCLTSQIIPEEKVRVLFMAEAQNARLKLSWLQNKNLTPGQTVNDLPQQLKYYIGMEQVKHLSIVRLRSGDNGETPIAIVKGTFAVKASGIYKWHGVCDRNGQSLYLSIGKAPKTAKFLLPKSLSRLDSGHKLTWNARLLEIAVVYSPEIEPDTLAYFVHSLRHRWPYFADEVSLPLPFPFAIKAKEYAVSTRDNIDFSGSDDDNA